MKLRDKIKEHIEIIADFCPELPNEEVIDIFLLELKAELIERKYGKPKKNGDEDGYHFTITNVRHHPNFNLNFLQNKDGPSNEGTRYKIFSICHERHNTNGPAFVVKYERINEEDEYWICGKKITKERFELIKKELDKEV